MKFKPFFIMQLLVLGLVLGYESLNAGVLLAKKDGKAAAGGGKSRERTIFREKTIKGAQKKVDFEAIDISGERKTPLGTLVQQNQSDKEFDLVKIRWNWHPEMIQSTSSLETGRSR